VTYLQAQRLDGDEPHLRCFGDTAYFIFYLLTYLTLKSRYGLSARARRAYAERVCLVQYRCLNEVRLWRSLATIARRDLRVVADRYPC